MRPATHDYQADGPLRRLLLALVLFGAVGLLAELVLLEHFDSATQWIPLALLVIVFGAAVAVGLRRAPRAVRFFQVVMAGCVVAGAVGVFLHYQGNVEFELERDGSLRGLRLFWEAIRGATPALAPGALSQLGLLGLAYTYRHPALRASITQVPEES
jgi:phosphotransferase system  glucose/maltose/N-acetylglucosamine-specific IIC component